jgi:alpha-glucosidase
VLRRRYCLLLLLYRLALEAHQTGLPIVRPLFMHYDVPRGRGADQFLLGDRVMAAPVLEKGVAHRDVWLPAGSWTHWLTGRRYAGNRMMTVEAPLGVTPIFVRSGTALFVAEPGRNAEETLRNPIALELYPPEPGTVGGGSLFLDDGESASSARFMLDAVVEDCGGVLGLRLAQNASSFVPAQRDFELRLPATFRSVTVDGLCLDLEARSLAAEGRSARMMVMRVPFAGRDQVKTSHCHGVDLIS